MRSVAAAAPGRASGSAGSAGVDKTRSNAAGSALAGSVDSQKEKEHAKEVKTLNTNIEHLTHGLRKSQDREAKLKEELSTMFIRLLQFRLCTADDISTCVRGLHLTSEHWELAMKGILAEVKPAGGDSAPPPTAQARDGTAGAAGGSSSSTAGAAFQNDGQNLASGNGPRGTSQRGGGGGAGYRTGGLEEGAADLLEESIFYGTAVSFTEQQKRENELRVKQLLVEVAAHKLRLAVVLRKKEKLKEKAKKFETDNYALKKRIDADRTGGRGKSDGSEEDISRDVNAVAEDQRKDAAAGDPSTQGRQRRVEKIVRKLQSLDKAKALLTRNLSTETKLRVLAEEEVQRLRDLLDRLRKSHRHQKLPEIQEANRMLENKSGRAGTASTSSASQAGGRDKQGTRGGSRGSPTSPRGGGLEHVDRKFRTREREQLRGGVRGKQLGPASPGGLREQDLKLLYSLETAELEFATCPVQKLRVRRETERREEEALEHLARGTPGQPPPRHGRNYELVSASEEPFLAHLREKQNGRAASPLSGSPSMEFLR
ncbi:unnamed protein product [Amoebophrya sp. A120]|nr:unnamed protein product [Amoebophrya sp. A120]|eukprot:GSA120T00017908001.1